MLQQCTAHSFIIITLVQVLLSWNVQFTSCIAYGEFSFDDDKKTISSNAWSRRYICLLMPPLLCKQINKPCNTSNRCILPNPCSHKFYCLCITEYAWTSLRYVAFLFSMNPLFYKHSPQAGYPRSNSFTELGVVCSFIPKTYVILLAAFGLRHADLDKAKRNLSSQRLTLILTVVLHRILGLLCFI